MDRKRKQFITVGVYLIILLGLVMVLANITKANNPEVVQLTTGEIMEYASEGNIEEISYFPASDLVSGNLVLDENEEGNNNSEFSVYIGGEENFRDLVSLAKESNKEFTWNVESSAPNFFLVS